MTSDSITIVGTIITIIGTIASVYSAIDAKKQAKKAKTVAKKVQANISHHRITSDISRLKEFTERMITTMKKYGPGANETMIQGADYEGDSITLQDFIITLEENTSTFSGKNRIQVINLRKTLSEELESFNKDTNSIDDRKKVGSSILSNLSMLNSLLKAILNKKVETSE